MTVKAVFLAESPLQVVNAAEARHAYGFDPRDSLLVVGPSVHGESARQMESLEARYDWRTTSASAAWERSIGGEPQVFVGDYRKTWQRAAARRVTRRRPVLLDDGTATLLIARRRHRRMWRLSDRSSAWGGSGRRARRLPMPALLGDVAHPGSRDHRSVEFFSIYRFPVRPRDRWTANRFEQLRSSAPPVTRRRPVYIGSSQIEKGSVAAAAIERTVERAAELGGSDLLYVAHRAEADEKLEGYVRRFGFEVIRPRVPIELLLVDEGVEPAPLMGVMSSAFDSLQVLYPALEVHRMPPRPEDIAPGLRRRLLRVLELTDAVEIVTPGLDSTDGPRHPSPTRGPAR